VLALRANFFTGVNFGEDMRLLKNSPAPASDPLFSANGAISEASEPDLTPLWTFNRLFQQAHLFSAAR
jgi:hypothetical protein